MSRTLSRDFCACEKAVRANVKLLSNQLMVAAHIHVHGQYSVAECRDLPFLHYGRGLTVTCATKAHFAGGADLDAGHLFTLICVSVCAKRAAMALSAKEQMSKMLDELMGQNRDGE